jgi:hypothetical protein
VIKQGFALALLALTGCSAAPQLRNVEVQADVSEQLAGRVTRFVEGVNYHGGHVGRVAVVLEQPITSSIAYRLSVEHTSLLNTDSDRGEERAAAGFTWRPFK